MEIADKKLLHLCDKFGKETLYWRKKFIGLLPEVNKRRLYEKRGCESIFEFAAKLAGLSHEQVALTLRLERRFLDKPALHEALVAGEVSLCKLARVASIATSENQAELVETAKLFPQKALETFARDIRNSENQNGLPKPLFEAKSMRAHCLNFELSEEVVDELNRLNDQGQDVNAIVMTALNQRKEQIEAKKAAIGPQTTSRYIPVRIKAILQEEFGKKCSIATCKKPAEQIHHTQRFSLAHTHDPHFMAPLCKEHHQIAHLIDLSYTKNACASAI